uniref:J domain-containing protein n=1 Tax=Meloidogyne incognita TaxID=6306 RepID=A0A914LA96_MELIC
MNYFLFPLLLLTFFKLFQPVELTNYYETLNINCYATKEQIETAYHNLVNEMVNDNGLDAQSKEIKLKDLKEAFKVLSDETSRARYDYYLKNIPGIFRQYYW